MNSMIMSTGGVITPSSNHGTNHSGRANTRQTPQYDYDSSNFVHRKLAQGIQAQFRSASSNDMIPLHLESQESQDSLSPDSKRKEKLMPYLQK